MLIFWRREINKKELFNVSIIIVPRILFLRYCWLSACCAHCDNKLVFPFWTEVWSCDLGLPRWLGGKESACNPGHLGSIPGSGRSLGVGLGNPLQYSCLENPMDRGAWQVIVRRVEKSQTQLKLLSVHARFLESDPYSQES